jgi:integrase
MPYVQKIDRPRPWRVFWWDGGRRRSKTFAIRRDAYQFAAALEAGTEAAAAGKVTLGQAVAAWLADRRACCRHATWEAYQSLAHGFAAHVGPNTRLDRITREQVEAWRNARAVDRSPRTVRASVKCVRMLLHWCVRHGYAARNPAVGVAVPAIRRTAPEWIDGPTTDRLLDELHDAPEMRLVCLLAARAGLRAGEIRGLRWEDVQGGTVRVNEGKSARPRYVPMHPQIAEALASWPRTGELIFPPRRKPADRRSDKQARDCNLWLKAHGYRITMHGLRHSCASQLAQAGASETEIRDLLGHTSTEITRLYVHARDSQKRAHVLALGGGPSAAPVSAPGTALTCATYEA